MPGLPALSNPVSEDRDTSARPVVLDDPQPAWEDARPKRARGDDETFSLGRYLITGRIASGGMATVYRARLESEGGFAREFALKVIHPHLAAADGFKERFLDEARVASRVNHPNVVATVDSDQDRGYHFLVLELVDGVTLRQLQVVDLQRSANESERRLRPTEAARVVCDAARGLHAVHTVVDDRGEALEVVHRDLSPHNLMLDVTGRTVLIDLGLAKARGQLGHTQTGVLCGKLPYMSPEQSRIEPLDARSDVFSLGSVLFELAVGVAPFGDDHTPGTLERLRNCDPERIGEALSDARVPSWLAQVVLTCLRADPSDRYSSAEALADALDEGMRRAGVNQSEVRQKLARRARALTERMGAIQPADPLPPLISADPTGPNRTLARPLLPTWARGLSMAAAGALLVLLGLVVVDLFDRDDGDGDEARSEAASSGTVGDDEIDELSGSPSPARTTAPDPAPTAGEDASADSAAEASAPDPGDDDAQGDVPRKTRRGHARGKPSPLEDYKPNPYI
ncbi:serine/threonine protein kinase [Pseudenhygromyxa sp. WMMC2535]|uniref:serine/threonine-protein kinase n=1 Tax=Pseudenhygromyxa sp. WMMC2535 TaxID=2712867 RepID=UPI0015568524|nr:serine/threonine-protein kinase [Pseudenhygromyxa sp. WMMC2535]NVB42230.1 serine/threonine protein kinase [Pseudenhygromyxa sp. WMMC2535]